MFAGQPINTTEDRAVLHTLLRIPAGAALAAGEAKMYGNTYWVDPCDGDSRSSWDDMAQAWALLEASAQEAAQNSASGA